MRVSNVHMIDDTGDDDDDAESPSLGSDLARARQDVEAYVAPDIELVHPNLPGYVLLFRSNIQFEETQKWRKACNTRRGRGREDELDGGKFSTLVVAGANTGVKLNGAALTDSTGAEVDFGNKEFMALFDVATRADLVKAFVITDAAIGALANKIMELNGFGEDAEEADRVPFDKG